MRKYIPWNIRIIIKIILSRIPIPYSFWAKIGLFKHGQMEKSTYARKIFSIHMDIANKQGISPDGTYLEMGVGDSVATALMSASRGASKTYLVDVGRFATQDMDFYRQFSQTLKDKGGSLEDFSNDMDFEKMLEQCHTEYLTKGLESLKRIPEGNVDFIWSHATLEHVRKDMFADTMQEAFRILAPGGVASHNIDYKDHLGGALNNLRFKEETWEADWMVNSGFYTNRIHYSDMLAVFTDCGFVIEDHQQRRWDTIPTPKNKLSAPFCDLPDDILLVSGMSVILRKPH